MVQCVLRISPVGLASAPDLLGVNLDAEREDFDLIDMPQSELSPPFKTLSPYSRERGGPPRKTPTVRFPDHHAILAPDM